MPRKGKRSQAQKVRWTKVSLADPSPVSPPTVNQEVPQTPPQPRNLWFTEDGPSWHCPSAKKVRQTETPPQAKNVCLTDLAPSWQRSPAMPRGESPRRVDAEQHDVDIVFSGVDCPRKGTGDRHRVKRWPVSERTGKSHKFVIKEVSADNKFCLLVGDSHFRAIVDGWVALPLEKMSFGVMATPGACAAELRTEVLGAVVPRTPDAVCVLAPSNNLTASATISQAAVDFRKLLSSVCSRWNEVFVLDFPPRLNVDLMKQDLLRQEYHRVAAQMGIRFVSIVERFPMKQLNLWSKDGVHLSDNHGMPVLVEALGVAVCQQLNKPTPKAVTFPKPSPPRFSPKLVVKGEVKAPRPPPNPFEWTVVGHSKGRTVSHDHVDAPAKKTMVEVMKDCYFPLSPVRFNAAVLDIGEDVPSALCGSADCSDVVTVTKRVNRRQRRTASSKRTIVKQLVGQQKTAMLPEKSAVRQQEDTVLPTVPNQSTSKDASASELEKVPQTRTPPQPRSPTGPNWRQSPAKKIHHSAHGQPQTVRASHSQSDERYNWFSRNHQCTCNALTFLAYHSEGSQFDTTSLDRVLEQGDSLYAGTKSQLLLDNSFVDDHLTVEEMPKHVVTDTTLYSVRMSSVRCGPLKAQKESFGGTLPLDTQLECLTSEVPLAFLIVSPECIAVFRDNTGRYGVFDSHSRNAAGLPHPDGTAVMLTFNLLSDMITHLHTLFQDRGAYASYEFVPVSFVPDKRNNSSERPAQPHSETTAPTQDKDSQTFCIPQAEVRVEAMEAKDNQKGQPKNLDPKLNKQQRIKAKNRRHTNEKQNEQPETRNQREKNKYARCTEFRMKKVQAMKTKYAQDCHHREQKLLSSKHHYADPHVQNIKKQSIARRYRTDPDFQNRRKKYITNRYNTDADFQARQKEYITNRYNTDADFQARQKEYIANRHNADPDFQNCRKKYLAQRYACNQDYRQKRKQSLQTKYHSDPTFRLRHIQSCTQHKRNRLSTNAALHIHHKLQCALRLKRKYRQIHCHQNPQPEVQPQPLIDSVMQAAISSFREVIKHGPTYVCTVCHRTLFSNQVKRCNRSKYVKNIPVVDACLTGKYVHVCDSECSPVCTTPRERMQEWICHTCDRYLSRGTMPSVALANKLELAPIPPELAVLNVLERQLIAKILPFAKIVALPKGQQRAVHGAVVCVPSEVQSTVNCLPRPSNEAQLLQVKLKRRIKYKGHQYFYTVNMKNVLAGLTKLKEMHSEYKDVSIDENATFSSLTDDPPSEETEQEREMETPAEANTEQAKQSLNPENGEEELRPGLALDTCMQPDDLAQELLSYGDGIFSIAPAQGNKPVGFFSIPKLEAMAFPVQFPTGQNTFDEVRKLKLSPSMYFNARLFCADTRFANDQSYLFFAQFVTETHIAKNSMSIQMRKGKPFTGAGQRISNRMLQDKHELEKLIHNKEATRFMQPLRGTPAYWEKTLKDLNAMVRQLGAPTFFLTFSAAEMRWPEVIEAIKAQQGEQVDFSELDWQAKCDILRSNPVTVMRLFEKRVDALMSNLILSHAQPIGEVEDFFFRVEYQARGSPHIHVIVWIKNAPQFGEDDDDKVIKFIDKYITCQMPDVNADPELNKIVSEVQVHSRNHSKSCRKGKVLCRFGFPKLPTDKTIITYPDDMCDDDEDEDGNQQSKSGKEKDNKPKKARKKRALGKKQREAKAKLQPLRNLLSDPDASFNSLSELLEKCNMTPEEYNQCINDLTSGNVILLKRRPNECWVNGYNANLLRAWNANMDIQFVLDEFSCLMYMMSYVSKPEHEMSEFLNNVIRDVRKKDVNVREEMKQIMQAYAKHRQVSAQESVARTCSLPLKKCSRNVVFIQTDDDAVKMSLPMNRLREMAPDAEEVWMSGIPEKYTERPETPEFEHMCLAEFASQYRTLYGRQTEGKNAIPLLHDKGHVQKRTVGKPAIIRFPRFSETKTPEKFYGRLLKLYFPHRSNKDLKNEEHPTYELFYKSGSKWGFDVRFLVDAMKKRYEGHGKKIEKALAKIQQQGPILNAWNTFAPEVEVDRLECIAEREPLNEENEQDNVPDYDAKCDKGGVLPAIEAPKLSPDFVRKLYQSLNEEQASIFYTVREWCLKRVWGHNPEQFFYFVSGGAGCGKSHVIKCIYEEATKILRQLPRFCNEADMSMPAVLLTAFTGTAAFNISGKTLHSILKLPRSLKAPYQGLGNALDELRATLSNADILIIDEISMISKELFAYVHWRFQQIKGNKKPFGGMSVLAVGDFYQLPPLGKAKPLCVYEGDVLDLWRDNFQMVNLTQIMRQKDDLAFAQLLNRMRVKLKSDALSNDDRTLLTQAVHDNKDCPLDALHIFATNREVNDHNSATVAALHSDFVNIQAETYKKDPTTGAMIQARGIKGTKTDLPDNIMAAQGVRVMMIRNLDVEDGIVNGTFGTLANIVTKDQNGQRTVTLLGLQLDNPTAGQRFRKKILGKTDNLVYIERSEEHMSKRGVVRRQFPLKLAFACTAHKVQGMTMQSAVVSLKRVFGPGMSYVALSRTTSLERLYITDFEEKKIYADPAITAALENMRKVSFHSTRPLLQHVKSMDQTARRLILIHHNAQGLPSHIEDMKCHHELGLADVLCITETHLSGSSVAPNFQLEGYNVFTRSRHTSYANHPNMAQKDGGGVAVYCKSHIHAEARRYMYTDVTDLEFLVVKVEAPVSALIAAVYRPPNFSLDKFLPNMRSLLDSLDMMNHQPVIVCGDFNEDLLSKGKKAIQELLQSRGYTQLVTAATTEKETLIDHIYISQPHTCVQSGVLQTYYSYHSPVYCILSL